MRWSVYSRRGQRDKAAKGSLNCWIISSSGYEWKQSTKDSTDVYLLIIVHAVLSMQSKTRNLVSFNIYY